MAKLSNSPLDRKLIGFIRSGYIFKLQEELRNCVQSNITGINWTELLRAAIDVEFHDMVQVVLEMRTWTQDELEHALDRAVWNRRLDIAELVISKGATLNRMEIHDICHTMDAELIRSYLRRGVDPTWENGFARALNSSKAKSLLGIYRSLRDEFPVLDAQAALALSNAVNEKNIRWTSLLRWAGADPFLPVPWGLDGDWGDEESMTTAADRACWDGYEEVFKVLKLQPTPEQACELLHHASWNPNLFAVRYLLPFIPREKINDTGRGSSRALEEAIRQEHRDYGFESSKKPEREQKTLECVEALLDHGARWNPDDDHLRWTRRGLGAHDGKYVVRIVRLLLYTAGACEPVRIWELCRTDKLRLGISSADRALWNELTALKPQ